MRDFEVWTNPKKVKAAIFDLVIYISARACDSKPRFTTSKPPKKIKSYLELPISLETTNMSLFEITLHRVKKTMIDGPLDGIPLKLYRLGNN